MLVKLYGRASDGGESRYSPAVCLGAVPKPVTGEIVALYFMYYNFGRVHQTLRVTPAMEAGIANHVWSIEEIIQLIH